LSPASPMYVQRLLLWSSHLYLNENRAMQKHDFPWKGQQRSPACKSVGLVLGAASSSSGVRVAPPLRLPNISYAKLRFSAISHVRW
jgi:hypothetical protein